MHQDHTWDVVVVGGGTAGVIAAVAAARTGARTLLVEKYGYPGGVASHGIPFLAFFSGQGKQVVGGLPQELVDRMVRLGGSPGHCTGGVWRTDPDDPQQFALTPYDPEAYAVAAMDLLTEAGVRCLCHTLLAQVSVEDQVIKHIEVVNQDGKKELSAHVYIDASGDGLLAAAAGFASRKGDAAMRMQNASLIFTLCAVDLDAMVAAMSRETGFSGWQTWHTRLIRGKKCGSDRPGIIHVAGHMHPWKDQRALTFTAVSAREGSVSLNMTRTTGIDGSVNEDLVHAEWSQRHQLLDVVGAMRRNIAGFERALVGYIAPQVGIRESRNIIGELVLTRDDVVSCREFEDNIARGAYPIDIHDPLGGPTQFVFLKGGGSYGIPYRALVPKGSRNLLLAGRCLSASHEAHGSTRIMATAMATGQAAGTAAAQLVQNQAAHPLDLDLDHLRQTLRANGALLDLADL